jgi:hypothetical protein
MKIRPVLMMCMVLTGIVWPGAFAADFNMSTIIRAGGNGNTDYELGIGPEGSSGANRGNVNPYYSSSTQYAFRVGYTNATNRAYVSIQRANGQWTQVNYGPGGTGLGVGASWTIPASSLYVSATPAVWPTRVTISNLTLGSGLTVLSGLSTTTLTAQQWLSSDIDALTAPVIFRTTAATGGDWLLSGLIQFTGLASDTFGLGARGSQLAFDLGARGTSETPEPDARAMVVIGVVLLWCGSGLRKLRGGYC